MGRLTRSIVLAVTLAVAVGIPLVASAQQGRWRAGPPPDSPPSQSAVQEARQRYQKALKLYDQEGAVEAALAELQRAYDLAPNHKILYNIGLAARTQRDYALALHAFERYLADGGDKIKADRRTAVLKEIKELKTYVSALAIRVNVDGAKIYVDDAYVGDSPLSEPVMVNAGRVSVRAVSGETQDTKSLVVPGGDQIAVELELALTAAMAPGTSPTSTGSPPEGEPTSPDEPEASNPYLWIGFAVAGLLAVGAGITGGIALSESSDLEDATYAGRQVPDDLASKQDTVDALAITTDVLIAAAGVALATTVIVWLTGAGAVEPEPAQSAGVGCSADGCGLLVRGRF